MENTNKTAQYRMQNIILFPVIDQNERETAVLLLFYSHCYPLAIDTWLWTEPKKLQREMK